MATIAVTIQGMAFGPQSIQVAVGDTITWTNMDPMTHTATADSNDFDSGRLDQNDTYSWTVSDPPRQVSYHCAIHGARMSGTVTITAP
jgi:plastocyanin